MAELKKAVGKRSITDTNLLLTITIVVFAAMYLFAMFGLGRGFLRWQTFFNILNTNASLIITAIGLSIVMIHDLRQHRHLRRRRRRTRHHVLCREP